MAKKPDPRPRSFGVGAESAIEVVGAPRAWFRDLYHGFLLMPWSLMFLVIAGVFLVVNAVFAEGYLLSHQVAGARPGSFTDAFFFSVQTFGTIGYGAMYPNGTIAHSLVVAESLCSLVVAAVFTGLVFAKFSRSTARIRFSHNATISLMDGIQTLAIRIGNERSSHVAESTVRMSIVRTEKTAEGMTWYRMYDLGLVRDRQPALARSWTVLHRIDDKSPLYRQTSAQLIADDLELIVTIQGTDDTTMQPVHARWAYLADEILFGQRPADMLTEIEGGKLRLDLRQFHEVVPAPHEKAHSASAE
jgi:inward rectifier potassium channel